LVAGALLLKGSHGPGGALRESAFQVVSMITTTGYCTADFDKWPDFTRAMLVALMFVGGCAGSTGGSMKVVRWVVVSKMAFREVQKFFVPRLVKQVRVGRTVIPENTLNGVAGFFFLFIMVWALGTLLMSTMTPDLETAGTAVIACLGNIGPGLAKVGAIEHFGWVPAPGKWFLSMCMVLGRLELYTVLVLFAPSFWKE
jgi:trk system potassium uptake protein TrkH